MADGSQVAPIHLCLLAGRRLEAAHGHSLSLGPQGLQEVLDGRVASRISLLLKFTQQDDGVPYAIGQALLNEGLIALDKFGTRYPGTIGRDFTRLQIFADRLAVEAGEPLDLADGKTITFHLTDAVHVYTS